MTAPRTTSRIEKIDAALSVRHGRLYLEDCDLVDIARRFGTPLFVVSEDQIRRNIRRMTEAFASRWTEGEAQILPAIKASPLVAVRRILSEEGAGCDTFGPSELEGAIRGGCRPDLISLNGSVKDRETIRRGIEVGAQIVLDSPRELDLCRDEARRLGKRARVLFRLKPYMADLETQSDFSPHPIRLTTQVIKYGIPTNEVRPMGPAAFADDHIDAVGVHCHIGRQSTDPEVWRALIRSYVGLIAELGEEWGGWVPRIIDVGGGLPSPRDYDPDVVLKSGRPAPAIEIYAEAITSTLRETLRKHGIDPLGVTLQCEPGRSMHGDTGLHLTSVVNVKKMSRPLEMTWLETDTSEFFLGTFGYDPSTPLFHFKFANRADERDVETVDIVGKSCGGEFMLRDVKTPAASAGDIVALLDTGAYMETIACNFNAMPRPGTVLVRGDEAFWVKRPETIDDVYDRDIVPIHLA